MRKYVLDTNVYITAARDRLFGAELVQFAGSFLPQLYLHAVVVQELTTGAIDEPARRRLDRDIIAPFERRGRLVVPSHRAWKRSGEIVAELIERGSFSAGGVQRSFLNEALLAASCREGGITLITLNDADFRRIATIEQVSFTAPWPRA